MQQSWRFCTRISSLRPSVKYVTLFLANFDPSVTLCHTSRDPGPSPPKVRHASRTPRFLVSLVQKSWEKAPCTNSISIVRGGFCPGVLSGLVFARSPFCHKGPSINDVTHQGGRRFCDDV